MCIPNFYKPLVFSRKSHTFSDSRARYLETAALVYSWYESDCWNTESLASKMIRRVNAMHRFVADKVRPINDSLDQKVEKVFQDANIDCDGALTEQDRILLADIAVIRDNSEIPPEFYDYVHDSKAFSQLDMTLVQGAFFGQYLLYPEHYGGKTTSQEELENFLTLWRTNGYFLGIDDAFNAVTDSFAETKVLAEIVMNKLLKPCMLHLDPQAIHMAKAALFPPMDYHVTVYASYQLAGYELPNLWASLSVLQKAKYYLRHLYIPHIYPLPVIKNIANFLSHKVLSTILTDYRNKGTKKMKNSLKYTIF